MAISTGHQDIELVNIDGEGARLLIDDDGVLSTEDYLQCIAKGEIPGHVAWSKIGYLPASTANSLTVCNFANDYIFPTTGMQMEVTSDHAEDKVDGTGARLLRIYYLDINGVDKTTDVVPAGTAVVPTTATDIYRVNYFRCISAGTGLYPAGTITLRHIDNTPIYSQLPPGSNRARCFAYTVPAGKNLYITNISFSAGYKTTGKTITFQTMANYNNLESVNTTVFFQVYSEVLLVDNAVNWDLKTPTKFGPMTDIKINAFGEADAICTCGARGWLETI